MILSGGERLLGIDCCESCVACSELLSRGCGNWGTTRELKVEAAKDLARIRGYLEMHSHRMRYDEYLRPGYPIASVVIEGCLLPPRQRPYGTKWDAFDSEGHAHAACACSVSATTGVVLADRMSVEAERTDPHRDLDTTSLRLWHAGCRNAGYTPGSAAG